MHPFEELAGSRESEMQVGHGVALAACDHYPDVSVASLLARFDELARPLAQTGLSSRSSEAQAVELSSYLFGAMGFAGNEQDYYDPRNSLLPDVFERRLGIPISLSLVFLEVASRLHVPAFGIALPGHFLVRVGGTSGEASAPGTPGTAFVDPFHGGALVDQDGLTALSRKFDARTFDPKWLEPVGPRAFLERWFTNLRYGYLSRGDHARAMVALDRLISLRPSAIYALRERGLLAARLGAYEAAKEDLRRALALSPNAEEAAVLERELSKLGKEPTIWS